ncbi:MAG: hypothetical protein KGJ55_04040 [Gammaproteobacteria bacterium]|nr:hypothetical protein [Gammaproteobacteria bacterium]
MKTTLELPDELMRALKMRAASSDRRLKDVVTEAIAAGLAAAEPGTVAGQRPSPAARSGSKGKGSARTRLDPALEALFAAGDAMAAAGVDFAAWAKRSRDVWR